MSLRSLTPGFSNPDDVNVNVGLLVLFKGIQTLFLSLRYIRGIIIIYLSTGYHSEYDDAVYFV
jgi:hypothetical protein